MEELTLLRQENQHLKYERTNTAAIKNNKFALLSNDDNSQDFPRLKSTTQARNNQGR